MSRFTLAAAAVLTAGLLVTSLTGAQAAPSGAPAQPKLPTQSAAGRTNDGPPANMIPKLESTFVAITPCRIVDTREGYGKLPKGAVSQFRVRGTSGFTGQGGKSGGCGIPGSATAVATNVTLTSVNSDGPIIAYPSDAAKPNANFTTAHKNKTETVNPVFGLAKTGVEPSLKLRTAAALSPHVIIDVTGYFAPQVEALINPSGTVYAGSPAVRTVAVNSTGSFSVTVDRDVANCTPQVHPYYANYYATAQTLNGNKVNVQVWYLNGTTYTPVSTYFYLSVTC